MSNASWTHIARTCVASPLLALSLATTAASARAPIDLATVLARYTKAMTDPGAPSLDRYEATGIVSGVGLTGVFHEWSAGDRQRSDASLGPRTQRTLQLGDRFFELDENGIEREYTGVLLRRARTQALIDSGEFAQHPEDCRLHVAPQVVDGSESSVLDVTAKDGDTETLYLSNATGLPVRVTFEEDDAETSIDLSDWRTVSGHRFAFKSVTSDGDRAFDTTQQTRTLVVDQPIDDTVFAPLAGRKIEMVGTQTVPLTLRDGHLYVQAAVDGRPYTFLVDTGAQNIVLDTRVAEQLKLPSVGNLEASGAKRTGGLGLVSIPTFSIGLGTLRNLVAASIDLHQTTDGAFAIDGILGYPFFATTMVTIDIAGHTMTFGAPGSLKPVGEKLAVDVDRQIPEVHLLVNGTVDAPFIVDTGNAAEVLLYKPFVDRHGGIVPFSSNTRNSYGIGGTTESYRTTLDQLDVGSIPIYHADTDVMQATRGAFADRFDAGNIGLGFLTNFVLTFDLANNALYVERSSAFDDGRSRN
jgi:predicted aspartyl protease